MNQETSNVPGGAAVACSALLADLESALSEYPKIPREVWIGTDSPVDKVRWLARRCDGDDRTISRLHRENADLKTLIGELSQLVWEHHSSTIMRPNVCPACSDGKWSKVLDMARGVKSPNNLHYDDTQNCEMCGCGMIACALGWRCPDCQHFVEAE